MIIIDTLRADEVGCLGSSLDLTPTLDALARRGVCLPRALSASSWTVPSVASILTGLWAHHHGVERGAVRRREAVMQPVLDEELVTVAEAFRDAGYFTVGVMANVHLSAELGFAQGFDVFHNAGWGTSDAVLSWLEEHYVEMVTDQPRLVWIHLFDPHHPYRPREPWFSALLSGEERESERRPGEVAWEHAGASMAELEVRPELSAGGDDLPILRAAYRSEIGRTDDAISRILELLEATDDTLIAVMADHGEEFRERGRLGHRSSLHPELIHVPFIVSRPTLLQPGASGGGPASSVDLFPTLLDLAGLPPIDGLDGVSLFDGAQLAPPRGRSVLSTVWVEGRRLRSIADDQSRLVLDDATNEARLFDELTDPRGFEDLSERDPAAVELMRRRLDLLGSAAGGGDVEMVPTVLDDEQLEQLRRLGYVE